MPYKSYLKHRRRRLSRKSSTRARSSRSARRPARFTGAQTPRRYKKTRAMARRISSIAEIEVKGKRFENMVPSLWDGLGTNVSKRQLSFNMGNEAINLQSYPPMKTLNMEITPSVKFVPDPVTGVPVATAGEVLKNYRFVKRNTILFQIKMGNEGSTPSNSFNHAPVEFQFLILKPRMQDLINVPFPSSHLWIDESGKVTGFNTKPDGSAAPHLSNLDQKTWLLNKRKFIVLKNQKFTLQPPKTVIDVSSPTENLGTAIAHGKVYPSSRVLRYDNIINKRLYYGDLPGNDVHPKNVNDNLFVVILASNPLQYRADNWELDMHTTTSYTDM